MQDWIEFGWAHRCEGQSSRGEQHEQHGIGNELGV